MKSATPKQMKAQAVALFQSPQLPLHMKFQHPFQYPDMLFQPGQRGNVVINARTALQSGIYQLGMKRLSGGEIDRRS